MADDPATKPIEQAKSIEQKGGERSDVSTTELAGPSKSMEEKGENRSGDSTAKLAGPSKMSELRDKELDLLRQINLWERGMPFDEHLFLQRRRILLESMEEKGGKRSGGTSAKLADASKSMEEKGGKRSGGTSAKLADASKMSELRDQELDLQRQRISLEELERVLLHTRRLTVYDKYNHLPIRLRRKGEKSGQGTVMSGDAGRKLEVSEWMSTDDETHLVLGIHPFHLEDFISILTPLCPTVKHFSIDSSVLLSLQSTRIPTPMPMRSVITVCIKTLIFDETLHDALLAVSNCFPNAESLDVQIYPRRSPSGQAYFHEVNSSSSLRELKLRFKVSSWYHCTTDSLLMDISTHCPNIVSLVLSGFGGWRLNMSGKDIISCKMPHLTNIQLEPIGTDDYYRFETLMTILHVVHVTSPCLKFVEAKNVQLGDAELTSVKWSRTSSGCELQLEGASAAVPMSDLMHLVLNELEAVTVLTFDRCKVDFPQSISCPPQSTGKESSLQELKFLNVKCPFSQTDRHKLSEMYPNVKVTVKPESQAPHEDTEQSTGMSLKPETKTFPSFTPSSTSSIDKPVGATSRVQVHEEQTDTQNTEEEGKEEEEEDHIVMESLPRETDKVNVKPIKMECCKRVGVEGGRLQLDPFGIVLDIPPGAIDSEAPQDISLSVLTDTPNLGNNKEEMSVCFGVQCLAPDDLVLKLPVTYTIPHCALITSTRYSGVEAVLYTGEGEYSPDAVVKERSILSRSGIPSCTIRKDVIKLKMNHFSWAKIKLRIKNLFFRGKKMCCWPFREKNVSLQKTPAILHSYLYDDINGNRELVKSQEGEHEFIPADTEQQVLIRAAEVDLKMTCYVKETVIGEPFVVPFDILMSGVRIRELFELDFSNQPDSVLVLLKVGQIESQRVKFAIRFDFSTSHTTGGASPQDQGRQEDFAGKLKVVAKRVVNDDEIDNLGEALGFEPEEIQLYVATNMKTQRVSYMGTLSMLRDWRKKQTEATECEALKGVLEKAGQIYLADELFGTS